MKYWKSPAGEVFGYDETDEAQLALMDTQTGATGWTDVTASWPPAAPAMPDPDAFMAATKTALGGPVALNALLRAYPLLQPMLAAQDWADAQALLADAKATAAITAAQAVAINAAAQTANLPITIS